MPPVSAAAVVSMCVLACMLLADGEASAEKPAACIAALLLVSISGLAGALPLVDLEEELVGGI